MTKPRHDDVMVFLVVFALIGLALVAKLLSAGPDFDDRDRRGWWPGAK